MEVFNANCLPGMVDNCNKFYFVVKDDGCEDIASKFSITPEQFYTWNPFIGDGCKHLWPQTYVCVGLIGVVPTSKPTSTPTSSKPSPTNGVITPTPIQTGMVSNCGAFYFVKRDDGCWGIANSNGITPEQFSLWNPAVGTDCKGLFPNTYVCVRLIGMSPPTLTRYLIRMHIFERMEWLIFQSARPCTTPTPTPTKPTNGIATPTPYLPGKTFTVNFHFHAKC